MVVHAEILTIRQDLDLEQGVTANFLVLRLPNQQVISALVEDSVVQMLIGLVAGGGGGSPRSVMPATSPAAPPVMTQEPSIAYKYDDDSASVFGGDVVTPTAAVHDIEPPFVEPPARPAMRQPTRSLKVQADERGNPIVVGTGVDVSSLVADGEPGDAGSI